LNPLPSPMRTVACKPRELTSTLNIIIKMTYCVAWKSRNNAFLIADTAMTTNDKREIYKPVKELTSLGTETYKNKNITVEEWTLKQFRISENFIICYAGVIDKAITIIQTIKKYYNEAEPLHSFQLAIDSVREENNKDEVQFLFAFHLKGFIKLYSYNINFDCQIDEIPEDTLIQIGSLSDKRFDYSDVANRMFKEQILKMKNPCKQFYQFLAYFQHLELHDKTLEKYAGGIYSGLYLNENGAYWNEDTSIIIYNRNLSSPSIELLGRINYCFRYNGLTLFSSFTEQMEFFIDTPNHPIYKFESVREELNKIHYDFQPKLFIFLAKDFRSISIIKTNGNNDNIHFLEQKEEREDATMYTTKYTYNFVRLLKGDPFPKDFLFNLYWDEIY
jgi:hypothetical protein